MRVLPVLRVSALALCTALAVPVARAQAPEAPASSPAAIAAPASAAPAAAAAMAARPGGTYGMTWREAWAYGGPVMWFIAGLSIFGLALVIYFVAVLRPQQMVPPGLLSDVLSRLRAGEAGEARRACESRACALSSIVLTALDYMRHVPRTDPALLRDMMEAEGARQAEGIQSQTQLLLDVAVIAPMLGLLGTVLGMLKAFGAVAHDMAAAKPVVLAQGVAEAIITTIFGLMVAIPGMMCYAWFRRRASRLVALLEAASTEVLTALLGNRAP